MNQHNASVLHIINRDKIANTIIGRLIEPTGIKAFSYINPEELLSSLPIQTPGCLLIDMLIPDMDPFSLMHELRKRGTFNPCIMMAHRIEEETLIKLLEHGVFGFLKKPLNQMQLVAMIQKAFFRDIAYSPFIERALDFGQRFETLGKKEKIVVKMALEGVTAREIAASLSVSPRTVENQRLKAFKKLKVVNTVDAAREMAIFETIQTLILNFA